ncbi:hypothetical protein PInf_021530 [Phytophthora infestans]|nr:hypothetical protein PInf_021530 [Phytophthora infestans]
MVFVNETVSFPPRQLVSVALDRASALLVGALDVQSLSMASLAVPRWSDFVLLHRMKNGGEWQVSGELQSSDARWLKPAEVVLAPRTAKSQASQVSGCDGVDERDTGGRGVVAIRGGGGLSLGPEHTGPSPIVVENRENEPALVSMADLGALVRQRDCKMGRKMS